MSSTPPKNPNVQGLAQRYRAALHRYLDKGSAAQLRAALTLGRQALKSGLGTLDLALIHEQAVLEDALALKISPTRRARNIQRAGVFFAEAMLPLEETHRAAREVNARLNELNRELNKHTRTLAASNTKLKKEIIKRKAVEATLRKSRQDAVQSLQESRRMQEQLRLLSRRVLSAQEDERKRISRELHDVVAQMLTGINIRLATLKSEAALSTKDFGRKISRTQRLVEESVDNVHRFARELRPAMLDDLGLIPALHTFMNSFTKETGIRVSLKTFAAVENLSIAKRTVLYRVAQEALNNVARHAQASRVDVNIQRVEDHVDVQIKDDGKAFDVGRVLNSKKVRHLGLLGMRERVEMLGGKFKVASAPGKGTTIHLKIPVNRVIKERKRP